MTKARILANLISDNAELADGQISVAEVVGAAPLANPTFTGGIDVTGTVTADGLTVDNINVDNNAISSTVGGLALNASGTFTLDTAAVERLRVGSNGDISFYEDTGTTPKFFWDASTERLGLGVSDPSANLHIRSASPVLKVSDSSASGAGPIIRLQREDTSIAEDDRVGEIEFYSNDVSGAGTSPRASIGAYANDQYQRVGIQFRTAPFGSATPVERMQIDQDGNVLVGQATASSNATGHGIYGSGLAYHVRSDAAPLYVNRKGTAGDMVTFADDGATRGVIGNTAAASGLTIYTPAGSGFGFYSNGIAPVNGSGVYADNSKDLGHSSYRWDDIYATNGTIQTSDRNEKQDIDVLSDAEQRVAVACKGLLRKFRWIDSVAEKGDDARIHFGIIAQDLQDAFAAEGLDAGRYAMFISSTWWETQTDVIAVAAVEAVEATYDEDGNELTPAVEAVEAKDAYTRTDTYDTLEEAPEDATERTRLGVRYPELLSFIIAAI